MCDVVYLFVLHTPILALVGKVAYGSKNHEKRRGLQSPYFRSWRVFTSAVGVFDVVMKSVGSILCKKQSSFFR